MPQSTEEAAIWQQFVPAWNAWREENSKAVALCRQFDQLGIRNPDDMKMNLEAARAGHYRAVSQVLQMLWSKEPITGGDDHTACAMGRWLASFQTDSAAAGQHIRSIDEPHRQFHAAVRQIRELVRNDKMDEAHAAYDKELAQIGRAHV